MDIDLVYLWVNGNDPEWIAKKNACIGGLSEGAENCKGRYVDNQDLKYSLRSVAKYAPWIHRIFIVTDNQVPDWLDTTNPKIRIVDHTEIMPSECLPCFNSVVIEHHLHKIPGLAEHFLYANDDMYINQPVTPETFFAKDGFPIVRLDRRALRKLGIFWKTKVKGRKMDNYRLTIQNAALLVEKKYGKYFSSRTHHNIDSYLKSDYEHTRQVFDSEISATLTNHMRADSDIQRNIYSYVPLVEHHAHRCFVSRKSSFRLHIDNARLYGKFQRCNPMLFCMNDSQYANDNDRSRALAFVSQLFPDKSEFEK